MKVGFVSFSYIYGPYSNGAATNLHLGLMLIDSTTCDVMSDSVNGNNVMGFRTSKIPYRTYCNELEPLLIYRINWATPPPRVTHPFPCVADRE